MASRPPLVALLALAVSQLAAVPTVPLAETFQLSELRFQYDAQSQYLHVSYAVHNRGASRERSALCIDFIDKDGYSTVYRRLGRLVLGAGKSDQAEGEAPLTTAAWRDTQVMRVSVQAPDCAREEGRQRSELLHLDKAGHPVPESQRPRGEPSAPDSDETPGPVFRLEDVRMTQTAQDELWVDYQITHLAKGRETGVLCARLFEDSSCSCRSLDHAEEVEEFDLGVGGSEQRHSLLRVRDLSKWSRGRSLSVYVGILGCSTPPQEASSNVLTFPKPASLHAPVKKAGKRP